MECVYAEEGEVWFDFGVAEEEDVDEFADLEVGGCDVLDDVGEEVGDVSALGDELLPGGGGEGSFRFRFSLLGARCTDYRCVGLPR